MEKPLPEDPAVAAALSRIDPERYERLGQDEAIEEAARHAPPPPRPRPHERAGRATRQRPGAFDLAVSRRLGATV